jgi:hypothetical protein
MKRECPWTNFICDKIRKDAKAIVTTSIDSGFPDRLIWGFKTITYIEFKGVDTIVEPLQMKVLFELHKRNPGAVCIVRQPGLIIDPVHYRTVATFDEKASGIRILEAIRQALLEIAKIRS